MHQQGIRMEGMSDLNALNLEPGEVVGGYTLISRLGSGAMGSVWRVRDDGGTTLERVFSMRPVAPGRIVKTGASARSLLKQQKQDHEGEQRRGELRRRDPVARHHLPDIRRTEAGALQKQGMDEFWKRIVSYRDTMTQSGELEEKRKKQERIITAWKRKPMKKQRENGVKTELIE